VLNDGSSECEGRRRGQVAIDVPYAIDILEIELGYDGSEIRECRKFQICRSDEGRARTWAWPCEEEDV
jgi:hypothetical protein